MAHADAAHMGLVDDGLIPGGLLALVTPPGERRVDHPGLGYIGSAVSVIKAEIGIRRAERVAEQPFRPLQFADQLLGVRVDQQFVGIEAMPGIRFVGTVDPIAVDHSRMGVGQIAVPDLIGVFGQFDAFQFLLALAVEQAQLDLGGMRGKQRKVDAQPVPGCAQREGLAFSDA